MKICHMGQHSPVLGEMCLLCASSTCKSPANCFTVEIIKFLDSHLTHNHILVGSITKPIKHLQNLLYCVVSYLYVSPRLKATGFSTSYAQVTCKILVKH